MPELDIDIVSYSDVDLVVSQIMSVEIGSNPLHLQLRKTAADFTVWLEATLDNMLSIQATTDTETVVLRVPTSKLVNLPVGEYVHSLVMSENSGTKRTGIWRGTWTHNAGPTRWPQGQA